MSDLGESQKPEPAAIYYVRQIHCDVENPSRGVIVTTGRNDPHLQLMIDGNAVTVDRKMFCKGMEAMNAG